MSAELVHKVTLSSGKIVHLRPMKMRIEELAAQAAASKAGDNTSMLSYFMQAEILKQLLVDLDGKKLSGSDVEQLDKLFSYGDIAELRKVVAQLMGESKASPQVEIVNSGEL